MALFWDDRGIKVSAVFTGPFNLIIGQVCDLVFEAPNQGHLWAKGLNMVMDD